MILYVENPKDSTPKLLELIQQFSNVAGYKIKAQKSIAFLYTNNVTVEREIRELIPFKIAPKIRKCLGILCLSGNISYRKEKTIDYEATLANSTGLGIRI